MTEAEDRIVAYTAKHFANGAALLAGSSVHVDKSFIVRLSCSHYALDLSSCVKAKDMPNWHAQMTYRVLDVSTIREIVARWCVSFLFS